MWSWAWIVAAGLSLSDPAPPADADTPNASFPSAKTEVKIRHPRLKGESITAIAERYGVTEAKLREWNPAIGAKTKKDEVIELTVDGDKPAMLPIYVRVGEKTGWRDLARRYDTTVEALKRDNPRFAKRKKPPKGGRVTVWLKSGVQRLPAAAPAQPLPTYTVTPGGVAVGPPHRGRLEGGVKLPESDLYTIRFEKLCFGTTLAIASIQSAIAGFRRETSFERDLFIGALSRKKGRKLRPHRSHRTGRDADIRLPALPHAVGYKLERDEIDWPATWALIDAFARTGEIHMIFLERKLWQRLRRAAMRTGATDEELERAFDVIHHSKGHTAHIHVRFDCSDEATDCVQ